MFRQIKSTKIVTLTKFCQKIIKANFCNFHTVGMWQTSKKAQWKKSRILSLKFYVKSILQNSKVLQLPFFAMKHVKMADFVSSFIMFDFT